MRSMTIVQLLLNSLLLDMKSMLTYQPSEERNFRVAWHGGESTQLHFQELKLQLVDDGYSGAYLHEWTDIDVRTLGGGLPTGTKELLHEMMDYYNYSIEMRLDSLSDTI